MGRNTWQFDMKEKERQKRKRRNPVWRGVGCLTIVVLTIAAFYFSGWFLAQNQANPMIYLPPEAIRPPFAASLPPFLIVRLVISFIFMVMAFGALSLIYAIAFPMQLGETDAPPMKRERRRPR
ncbi:MAG: hypothetical protein WD040_01345 [Anaerolineales bacterium]